MKSVALVATVTFYEEESSVLSNAYIQSDIGQSGKVLLQTPCDCKAKYFDRHTDVGRCGS